MGFFTKHVVQHKNEGYQEDSEHNFETFGNISAFFLDNLVLRSGGVYGVADGVSLKVADNMPLDLPAREFQSATSLNDMHRVMQIH